MSADLPYAGEQPRPKQHLDLFYPSTGSNVPAALFVHGGAWKERDRRYLRGWSGLYSNVGIALAQRGIATAVVSYRQSEPAESIADLAQASRWLVREADRFNARTNGIVLVGHSAGGHLVTQLAVAHPAVAPLCGVIAIGGFYDIERFADALGRHGRPLRVLFGDTDEARQRWSPGRHLHALPCPLIAAVATGDPASLRAEYDALLAHGAPVEGLSLGGSHMGVILQMGGRRDSTTDVIAEQIRRLTGIQS